MVDSESNTVSLPLVRLIINRRSLAVALAEYDWQTVNNPMLTKREREKRDRVGDDLYTHLFDFADEIVYGDRIEQLRGLDTSAVEGRYR